MCDINGKVVLQDGTPLPGVDILLKDEKVCSTTNEGTFEITDIDAGEIILTFMKEGYAFEPPSMTINLTGHLSIFPDIVARDITSVNDIPLADQVKIYPNPAGDFITFNCGQIAERVKEIIFTHVNGQVVKRVQPHELGLGIHDEFTISTNDLPPGIYICTALVGNSKVNKKTTVVR